MKITLCRGYIEEVVHDVVTPFESIARLKEIGIDYSESNDGEEYLFDAEKLHTIFSILMYTAIQFTPTGGLISFTSDYLEKDDNYTDFTFTVGDSGSGITPDELSLLFNRSYHADDSNPINSYDETGKDLATAKELAELMEGNLMAESELGKGVTFILQLLLRKAGNENVPFYESNRL